MKVYISAFAENIVEDIVRLRQIVRIIHEEGHTLVSDWIEPAYTRAKKGVKIEPEEWHQIYVESVDSIAQADVVIAEATKRSFAVGYQSATSIQLNKPTLILRHKNASDVSLAQGIDERGVVLRTYDDQTMDKFIRNFLQENDIPLKDMRFNFFITRNIYNYLRTASLRTGKTKAELIRELVKEEINKEGR